MDLGGGVGWRLGGGGRGVTAYRPSKRAYSTNKC